MKSDINQLLHEAFIRDFKQNKQMFEAELKQKAILYGTNGRLSVRICIN